MYLTGPPAWKETQCMYTHNNNVIPNAQNVFIGQFASSLLLAGNQSQRYNGTKLYFSLRLLKWGKIQETKVKITDSPEQLKSVICNFLMTNRSVCTICTVYPRSSIRVMSPEYVSRQLQLVFTSDLINFNTLIIRGPCDGRLMASFAEL